jgi:hypothetical protein
MTPIDKKKYLRIYSIIEILEINNLKVLNF